MEAKEVTAKIIEEAAKKVARKRRRERRKRKQRQREKRRPRYVGRGVSPKTAAYLRELRSAPSYQYDRYKGDTKKESIHRVEFKGDRSPKMLEKERAVTTKTSGKWTIYIDPSPQKESPPKTPSRLFLPDPSAFTPEETLRSPSSASKSSSGASKSPSNTTSRQLFINGGKSIGESEDESKEPFETP